MTNVTDTPTVRPGQVWADNDPRAAGRTFRIDEIRDDPNTGWLMAVCTILTNADETQAEIDHPTKPWYKPRDMRGRQTQIAVVRFARPTSTGYRLVQDAAEVQP
jgi:hypothetical protein